MQQELRILDNLRAVKNETENNILHGALLGAEEGLLVQLISFRNRLDERGLVKVDGEDDEDLHKARYGRYGVTESYVFVG